MILFTPEMAQAIVEGQKSVTRRRWKKPRVRVGSIHQCYTRPAFARPPGKPFARVRIVGIDYETMPGASVLRGLTDARMPGALAAEAWFEGFEDWGAFCRAYDLINGFGAATRQPCFRVEFELVKKGE